MKKFLRLVFIGAIGITTAFTLVGCEDTGYNEELHEDFSQDIKDAFEVSQEKSDDGVFDLSLHLGMHDSNVRTTGSTYYATGGLTNNHPSLTIDTIANITFSDEHGNVIRTKKIAIKIRPGETMYYDELVGLKSEIPRPKSVTISP